LSSIAVALVSGCMTGPDYVRSDPAAPANWSSPREGGVLDDPATVADWWTSLNDSVLNGLVERAVETNLDLAIAEARVREARAARGLAASVLWPSIGASGSYTRSQTVKPETPDPAFPLSMGISRGPQGITRSTTFRGQNGSITRSTTNDGSGNAPVQSTGATLTPSKPQSPPDRQSDLFQAGFDARWELDVFGGNRRAVEAADATIEATDEFRRDVFVSLLSEVARNYIELRAAQRRLEIALSNIEAQAGTVDITKARFDAGLTSELDVVRAEAQLASTQSQVPFLETQVAASMHRLAVLLGQEPGALKEELGKPATMPGAPDTVPVGLPSDLLRRRPDIRQAERELAAATARIGVATAELFPKFYLTGAFGGMSDSLGNVLSGANQIWSFGPSVDVPIFEGGRIRAGINVENARQEQAALAYEQSILFALEEVENGLVSFAQEQVRRESLKSSVKANQEAVRLANERYVRGLEGFLNVLQAQQQLYLSEDELVRSESFVLTDLIALYKALGGGWEVGEETAPTGP
jgi:NodT family efflux transporter outer membrane factor (OMF) lipoprotein